MNDAVDFFFFEYQIHKLPVTDIPLIENRRRMDRLPESGTEIVNDDNLFSCVDQFIYGVGTDISGSAQN